jgi:hypothetical protein
MTIGDKIGRISNLPEHRSVAETGDKFVGGDPKSAL